jgi:cell division protein FtsN
MEDNNGKQTLMVLITALGGLAILVLIGWVCFFNPMETEDKTEKPELALSSLGDLEQETLPEKSAEDLLLDGLQKGNEIPLIMEEEQDDERDILITMEEDVTNEEAPSVVEVIVPEPEPEPKVEAEPVEVPAAVIKSEPEEKTVTYKEVTQPIYWLQVGSFPNSVSADKLRSSLKDKGIDSVMQTRTVEEILYYRVRVGAFNIKSEAEDFKSKLLSLSEIDEVTLYTDSITKMVVAE